MPSKLKLIALCLFVASSTVAAEIHIPDDLKDWQQWVLKDKEYRHCPFNFNTGAAGAGDFICAWPGPMQLSADTSGAVFAQQWTIYAKEQWVALPGDASHWPDRVTANDRSVAVVARSNVPSVKLSPGTWRIAGQ